MALAHARCLCLPAAAGFGTPAQEPLASAWHPFQNQDASQTSSLSKIHTFHATFNFTVLGVDIQNLPS